MLKCMLKAILKDLKEALVFIRVILILLTIATGWTFLCIKIAEKIAGENNANVEVPVFFGLAIGLPAVFLIIGSYLQNVYEKCKKEK